MFFKFWNDQKLIEKSIPEGFEPTSCSTISQRGLSVEFWPDEPCAALFWDCTLLLMHVPSLLLTSCTFLSDNWVGGTTVEKSKADKDEE